MVDPGRSVPGHSKIPLHVRVIGKKITRFVEGDIKTISVTGTDQFPSFALRINFCNPSSWSLSIVGMASWIHNAREQLVLIPNLGKSVGIHFRYVGMVTRDDKNGLSIGRKDHTVRRSEEHTSELQSRENLVCRLLLEKKK